MKLASIFSDHVVLQRNAPVPVWGWGDPGEKVTVEFAGQRKAAVADKTGRWTAALDAMPAASKPATMVALSSTGQRVTIADVVVGDVYISSGQSNMHWVLRDAADAATEIAEANWPMIRQFDMPRVVAPVPPRDVKAAWSACSPQTAATFTAVGYFFAREIHRREGVAVGLLNNGWGGTRVEPWISRASLLTDPLCRAEVEAADRQKAAMSTEEMQRLREELEADPQDWLKRHSCPDPGNKGVTLGWATPTFNDSAWPTMQLPSGWKPRVPNNGVVWFRRTIDVPADRARGEITVRLGAIDKHDTTYLNGKQIGGLGWETVNAWCAARVYRVPAGVVRPGANTLAVRAYSYRNQGGLTGPADEMRLETPGGAIPLTGAWRYQVEHDFGSITDASLPRALPDADTPHALFDSMVGPLVPFAVRGAVWYQGESNASAPDLYRTRFPMLIRDWRAAFGEQLAFLFVQLANYRSSQGEESYCWPRLREAQAMTLREPRTAMAVTVDIGDPIDIHPRNKQEVGRRLALGAEAVVYGRRVVASGPTFESLTVTGREARVRFTNTAGGLKSARLFGVAGLPLEMPQDNVPVTGFEVAGADRVFHPAAARIDGDTVVVASDAVATPAAVRYAWSDTPACTLYNGELLPAAPFRSAEW
ncbi:MAG: sialate O-acetylesterase [Phycisphaerae bacterium]|nr:sialate O-acetylesterase [Phycisphaerae bacterium]